MISVDIKVILTAVVAKCRNQLAEIMVAAITARVGVAPIQYPTGKRHIPVWLKSVSYRHDPDGTRFFLRCTEDRFDDGSLAKAGLMARIRVLEWQNVKQVKGQFIYERDNENLRDPSDKAGGGASDPRGAYRIRGFNPGHDLDGDREPAGSRDFDGPGEQSDPGPESR